MNRKPEASWMVMGVGMGIALGVALHNLPAGLALGVGLGCLIGAPACQRSEKDEGAQ